MSNNNQTAPKTKHTRKTGGTPNLLHAVLSWDADGRARAACGKVWKQSMAEKFDDITHNYAGFVKCDACCIALYAQCYESAKRKHPDYTPERLDRVARIAYDMVVGEI
ncbi:MAG: hypothetical protein UHD09_09105 [Bifidobacterium sp.]|nr:hypothetical protein [Bifidobacterium sp.]